MLRKKSLIRYIRQIFAITEKNIFLELRTKSNVIMRFLNPIIQLFTLIFIFGLLFQVKEGFKIGYWSGENYVLFLLIAFAIQFSRSIIAKFNQLFNNEKYWKTLSAIMVAPVHRFTLLIGIMFSELILNSIPMIFIIIIAYILYPISLLYVFLFFLIFFLIFLTFGALGLLISAFGISNEEIVSYLFFILRFVFLFSCATFPKEIFPEMFQFIVILNPFYYLFDLLRLTWYLGINYDVAISHISLIHIIIIIIMPVFFLFISILLFEKVYKKYGITGY